MFKVGSIIVAKEKDMHFNIGEQLVVSWVGKSKQFLKVNKYPYTNFRICKFKLYNPKFIKRVRK